MSAELELNQHKTEIVVNGKANSYSITTGGHHKSDYQPLNGNSVVANTEAGNGFDQRKYHINKEHRESKTCHSCSTKICFFCSGFLVGLLLSLLLLSAFQYLSDNNNKSHQMRDQFRDQNRGSEKPLYGIRSSSLGPSISRSIKGFNTNSTNVTTNRHNFSPILVSNESLPTLTQIKSEVTTVRALVDEVKVSFQDNSGNEANPHVINDSYSFEGESYFVTTSASVERLEPIIPTTQKITEEVLIITETPENTLITTGAGNRYINNEYNNVSNSDHMNTIAPKVTENNQIFEITNASDVPEEVTPPNAVPEVTTVSNFPEVTTISNILPKVPNISEESTVAEVTTVSNVIPEITTVPNTASEVIIVTNVTEETMTNSYVNPEVTTIPDLIPEVTTDSESIPELAINSSGVPEVTEMTTTSELPELNITEVLTTKRETMEMMTTSERPMTEVVVNEVNSTSEAVMTTTNETIGEEYNTTETTTSVPYNVSSYNTSTESMMEIITNQSSLVTPSLNTSSEMTPVVTEATVFCLSNEFQCPNEINHCLSEELLCNGLIDCPNDGFDEKNCLATNCGLNFRCGSNTTNATEVKCISRQSYCDGIWDCDDGTDELGCHVMQCQKGEFLCKDGSACIKGKQACDHVINCPDHSDEIGCVNREKCESLGRFYCSDGLCIDFALRCDGYKDCFNGTDELLCETQTSCAERNGFLCQNNICVDKSKRCDKNNDCLDWSDEWSCVMSDTKGIVHYFSSLSNSWSPVCQKTDFQSTDADSICQQFGLWVSSNWTSVRLRPNGDQWVDMNGNHSSECETNSSVAVFCQEAGCGQSPTANSSVSSSEVPPSLTVVDNSGRECMGQVIASHWMVLSAKCLERLSNSTDLLVKAQQEVIVSQVFTHYRYSNFRSLRVADYDFALIRTQESLPISAVCLPSHTIDPAITCFDSEDGQFEVIETKVCNNSDHMNGILSSRHFCAKSSAGRECRSVLKPLMCLSSQSLWYVSGFGSYEYGCNGTAFVGYGHTTHPIVFSNVYSVRQWIEQTIGVNDYMSKSLENTYQLVNEESVTTIEPIIETTTQLTERVDNVNQTMIIALNETLAEEVTTETFNDTDVTTTEPMTTSEVLMPTLLANFSSF